MSVAPTNRSRCDARWLVVAIVVAACTESVPETYDGIGTDRSAVGSAPSEPKSVRWAPGQATIEDAAFDEVLDRLRRAVENRDAETVLAHVDAGFFIERDFGGIFDADAPAQENFNAAYPLDNTYLAEAYRDLGFRLLHHDLGSRFMAVDDRVCGPPAIDFDAPNDDDWPQPCYFVDGPGVMLSASPALDSGTVALSENELVEVTQPGRLSLDKPGGPVAIEVRRFDGTNGFVPRRVVLDCVPRRLCFVKSTQSWRIGGVILGGD